MPAPFREKPRYFVIVPVDSDYCIQLVKAFRDREVGSYRLQKQCGVFTKPGEDRAIVDFVVATSEFLQAVRAARVRMLLRRHGISSPGPRRRGARRRVEPP